MDNLNTLPFALDYGLENGPVLLAKDMTNGDFVDSLTEIDFNYTYISHPAVYQTEDFWESIANNTTGVVKDSAGFVWDTASGTWDTIKSGAESVANAVSDAGAKISGGIGGVFDSLLMRIILIFVILVGAVWLLAKTGVISDAAKIFVASKGG